MKRTCLAHRLSTARWIEGELLVVWDGSPIHRGQAVKDFLASGRARGCNWSNYLIMLRTSTSTKGSGSTCSMQSY
jgi:hypothetical protein